MIVSHLVYLLSWPERRQFRLFCEKGQEGSFLREEQLIRLASSGFVLDPKAWKENEKLDRPLSAMELVCKLVPAKFLLCPTPIAIPKQDESPSAIENVQSFAFVDAVGAAQPTTRWRGPSADEPTSDADPMLLGAQVLHNYAPPYPPMAHNLSDVQLNNQKSTDG